MENLLVDYRKSNKFYFLSFCESETPWKTDLVLQATELLHPYEMPSSATISISGHFQWPERADVECESAYITRVLVSFRSCWAWHLFPRPTNNKMIYLKFNCKRLQNILSPFKFYFIFIFNQYSLFATFFYTISSKEC